MLDAVKIGKLILVSRQDKGFTQEELASKLGITPQAVSRWERGNSLPDIDFLLPLSNLLDISIEGLLTGSHTSKESINENKQPISVIDLIQTDEILMRIGQDLILLVDTAQGGDFLEHIVETRRKLSMKYGVVIPTVRLRDEISFDKNYYEISIMGKIVANNKAYPVRSYIFIDENKSAEKYSGIEFQEPISKNKALWVLNDEIDKDSAVEFITCAQLIRRHFQHVIEQNLSMLISREMAKLLADATAIKYPVTVEEAVPNRMSYGNFAKLLVSLLNSGKSVRNMYEILNHICDAKHVDDIPALAEELSALL